MGGGRTKELRKVGGGRCQGAAAHTFKKVTTVRNQNFEIMNQDCSGTSGKSSPQTEQKEKTSGVDRKFYTEKIFQGWGKI